MKKHLLVRIIAVIILLAAVFYVGWLKSQPPPTSIEYKNTDYGFTVTLPLSWQGYTVSADRWTGYAIGGTGDVAAATGPFISIHNPRWTGANTYQDIPIYVFTISQWADLQAEKFHISAAPIGPSELGRNAKYVFALPARYNFAFPSGYEEVERIMQSKPLTAF